MVRILSILALVVMVLAPYTSAADPAGKRIKITGRAVGTTPAAQPIRGP